MSDELNESAPVGVTRTSVTAGFEALAIDILLCVISYADVSSAIQMAQISGSELLRIYVRTDTIGGLLDLQGPPPTAR
jgi:hypothetical protein